MKPKKLYRSQKDRVITGVFGGLGDYFNVDANILRLAWILITAFTGFIPGIIAYILAVIIIPLSEK
ncbi:MAG: PspC domain-containing protein [bacterium]|nr:PspC domain-containing protein [bacterium]